MRNPPAVAYCIDQPAPCYDNRYDRNDVDLTIDFFTPKSMPDAMKQWVFELAKTNMQAMYEESEWGWDDKKKLHECFEDDARYIVARQKDEAQTPVAFLHSRFELEGACPPRNAAQPAAVAGRRAAPGSLRPSEKPPTPTTPSPPHTHSHTPRLVPLFLAQGRPR